MKLSRVYSGFRGRLCSSIAEKCDYKTSSHIVVFESDDWGSIRMSTRKDWEELLRLGYAVDKRPYERFDTLESPADLEALFEVFSKHKDAEGNHPVLTANMLMANPDFEKIKEDNFHVYHLEPISTTYTRYFGNTKALSLMKQGLDAGVFMPQSHGREHFNVAQWISGLQSGDEDLITAFKFGICGIAPKAQPNKGNQLMNALRAANEKEQSEIDSIVQEGLGMFEQMWGFKSATFVAPCYCWNNQTEEVLIRNGVRLIQTSRANKPAYQSSTKHFYSGQHGKSGLLYSIRNCCFEPSTNEGGMSVDSLMKQVDNAFIHNKIAAFSTHRINYVSGIDERNRTHTLKILDGFLTELLRKYPDTVFISSDKLIYLFDK